MIASLKHSILALICFVLIIPLYFNLAIVHAQVADKQSKQLENDRTKEFSRQEILEKAKKSWNFLKFSEDVDALNRFKKEYKETLYAEKAERRIKYLNIVRERDEKFKREQQAIVRQESESPVNSATPSLISRHQTWSAYRLKDSANEATCYVAGTPVRVTPDDRDHGDIFFMLTKYAANKSFEPHFTVGYPFEASSSVRVKIGEKSFKMFTKDDDAWVEKISQEAAFLSAMKSAANMDLSGFANSGMEVKYRFSLHGITEALNALGKCS